MEAIKILKEIRWLMDSRCSHCLFDKRGRRLDCHCDACIRRITSKIAELFAPEITVEIPPDHFVGRFKG